MARTILIKRTQPQQLLTINIPSIDEVFPGFVLGDFVVIHGSSSANSLVSQICAQAQKAQGFNSNVISIEGTDSLNQEYINRLAKIQDIEARQTPTQVYHFRAFSAYQMTSIVLERLNHTVEKYDAKLVAIPDLAGLFLSEDIAEEEATRVFSQVIAYLQNLARSKRIIIITTHIARKGNSRSRELKRDLCGKAEVVVSVSETPYDRSFALEKHPRFLLGEAEYPRQQHSLSSFFSAKQPC